MKSPVSRSKSKGFTLIELLLVIAIVAILASMLLSLLGRAKLKATGAVCLGNQKQLVMGFSMYADDNEAEIVSQDVGLKMAAAGGFGLGHILPEI